MSDLETRLLRVLLVACVLVSTGASGAMQVTIVPSVALSTIHDDNVLLQQNAESDVVTRASPSIALDAKSQRTSFVGSYSFDAENYRSHDELDSGRARYTGDVKLKYDATRQLQLGLNVLRAMTTTAGELNPGTGVQPGRIEARRRSYSPYARYQIDANWRLRFDFTQVHDELAGSPNVKTRTTSAELTRSLAKDDSIGIDYQHLAYYFEGAPDESANLLLLQWGHSFNERLRMTLAAGPRRESAGQTRLDAAGSFKYTLARGVVRADASREQNTLLGEVGTVTIKSGSISMGYMLTRDLGISIEGGHSNMTSANFLARSNEAAAQAWYRFSPVLSLVAGYRYFGQRGDALVVPLQHRTITLTLVLGWPAPKDSPQLTPDKRFLTASLASARQMGQRNSGSQMTGAM